MQRSVLLIDIGSTNIKWMVSNYRGMITTRHSVPFPEPLINRHPYFEVAIDDVTTIVKEIIESNRDDITAVMFSVQMHAYLLTDRDGRHLSNLITWRDQRAQDYVGALKLTSDHGVGVKANLPRLALLKLCDQQKDKYDQIGHFYTLGSYLSFFLTGINMTHISDAAASGFYKLNPLATYDTPFLLPEVSEKLAIVGRYNNIDVFTPIGDHQASIASIEESDDAYILNLGTAGQMCTLSDALMYGSYETRPYFDNKSLLSCTGVPGGIFIKDATDAQIDDAISKYQAAINTLPKRNRLIIVGGPTKHQRPKITTIANKIGLITTIIDERDALDGLNKLWRNHIMNSVKTGIMLSELYSPNLPILCKKCGYDFLIIDCEHGAFDYFMIASMVTTARLIGIKALVRLPDNLRRDIIRLLDLGVDGLILPNTNTVDDIARVIEYAKYPPIGKRGLSTTRAHTFYDPPELSEYVDRANNHVEIYAEIETRAGLENVKAIIGLDGVSGAIIGPNDLSADYGIIGLPANTHVLEAIEEVASVAFNLGKISGIITTEKSLNDKALMHGMSMFCLGSELSLIKKGGRSAVSSLKKAYDHE